MVRRRELGLGGLPQYRRGHDYPGRVTAGLPTTRVEATVGLPMESLQGITKNAVLPIDVWGPFARILMAAGASAVTLGTVEHEPYHPEHRRDDLVADATGFAIMVLAVCAMARAKRPGS
jgi:hypothetical protein